MAKILNFEKRRRKLYGQEIKEWVTVGDSRVRPGCMAAGAQRCSFRYHIKKPRGVNRIPEIVCCIVGCLIVCFYVALIIMLLWVIAFN